MQFITSAHHRSKLLEICLTISRCAGFAKQIKKSFLAQVTVLVIKNILLDIYDSYCVANNGSADHVMLSINEVYSTLSKK